ncbi:unnamed protein product [Prorocentrum cordatum]|uniref:Uncharacterized protein n=1 Tax=Prorocentrum cordatum TaxID=2364126 RepID=A0ABN9VIY0_9DINO|nr:unnamed protein product [Polarella glacialis]
MEREDQDEDEDALRSRDGVNWQFVGKDFAIYVGYENAVLVCSFNFQSPNQAKKAVAVRLRRGSSRARLTGWSAFVAGPAASPGASPGPRHAGLKLRTAIGPAVRTPIFVASGSASVCFGPASVAAWDGVPPTRLSGAPSALDRQPAVGIAALLGDRAAARALPAPFGPEPGGGSREGAGGLLLRPRLRPSGARRRKPPPLKGIPLTPSLRRPAPGDLPGIELPGGAGEWLWVVPSLAPAAAAAGPQGRAPPEGARPAPPPPLSLRFQGGAARQPIIRRSLP